MINKPDPGEASSLTWAHCHTLQLTRDGDILLVLDSGAAYPAHSVYMKHSSTVLAEAFALDSPRDGRLRIPIPGTIAEDLLLLLRAYSHFSSLLELLRANMSSLWSVARLSDQLGCGQVLQQIDWMLVQESGSTATTLNADNAVTLFAESQRWGLEQMQHKVTEYILDNIRKVHFPVPMPLSADLSPVLHKVAPFCLSRVEASSLRQQVQRAHSSLISVSTAHQKIARRVQHALNQFEGVELDIPNARKCSRMRNHLDECLRSISRGVDMCQVSDGLVSGLNNSLSFLNSIAK